MQDAKKSLIATIGVVVVIAATVGGGLVRSRMEIGPGVPVGGSIMMDSLVTSTEGIPGVSETSKGPISEATYFYQLTQLLESEYVDPITDEQALAIGAIKGMVGSLADSESLFHKPEQMSALMNRRKGVFEGIGVEVRLDYDKEEHKKLQNRSIGVNGEEPNVNIDVLLLIPTVVVSTVVPGSPADKAGLKVGDRIVRIDKKWALSSIEVSELRKLRADFDAGKMSADDLQNVMDSFREKFESSMAPARAADKLVTGTSGEIEVAWRSADGTDKSARIAKAKSVLPTVTENGGVVTLRFLDGAADKLSDMKLGAQTTIDLRQSTMGDYESMRKCLALLAPTGEYGTIAREQAGSAPKLTVTDGASTRRHYKLIVDNSTWGAAAVFAEALSKSGLATLDGTLPDDLPWIEVFDLPGGSGYTLRTGTFAAKGVAQ